MSAIGSSRVIWQLLHLTYTRPTRDPGDELQCLDPHEGSALTSAQSAVGLNGQSLCTHADWRCNHEQDLWCIRSGQTDRVMRLAVAADQYIARHLMCLQCQYQMSRLVGHTDLLGDCVDM